MKCRETRLELPEFVRGKSDSSTADLVRGHLAVCKDCAGEMKMLETLFRSIDGDPWSPPKTYWASILPRIHRGLDQRASSSVPAWAARFALPAAAAVVLAVAFFKVGTKPADDLSDNVAAVMAQMAPDEIQDVADRQSVAEALQPDLVTVHPITPAEDVGNVEAILQEDGARPADIDAEAAVGIEEPGQAAAERTQGGGNDIDSIHY